MKHIFELRRKDQIEERSSLLRTTQLLKAAAKRKSGKNLALNRIGRLDLCEVGAEPSSQLGAGHIVSS